MIRQVTLSQLGMAVPSPALKEALRRVARNLLAVCSAETFKEVSWHFLNPNKEQKFVVEESIIHIRDLMAQLDRSFEWC
jgi:hypothetical protein